MKNTPDSKAVVSKIDIVIICAEGAAPGRVRRRRLPGEPRPRTRAASLPGVGLRAHSERSNSARSRNWATSDLK